MNEKYKTSIENIFSPDGPWDRSAILEIETLKSTISALKSANQQLQEIVTESGERERRNIKRAVELVTDFFDNRSYSDSLHFTPMLSVCCLCGTPYAVKDGKGVTELSHGYCPDCGQKAREV